MGRDIHWVVEVKHNDRWVGVLGSNYVNVPASSRYYGFFREFEVRGDSPTAVEPRGLPDDISDLTRYDIEGGSWDHSHSWLPLQDFDAAWKRAEGKYSPEGQFEKMFGEDFWPNIGEEYRIVFAFDN